MSMRNQATGRDLTNMEWYELDYFMTSHTEVHRFFRRPKTFALSFSDHFGKTCLQLSQRIPLLGSLDLTQFVMDNFFEDRTHVMTF